MNHDMQVRLAYLRRRALMRGHTFTKRTYRKARGYAIDALVRQLNERAAIEREQRRAARFGDSDAYSSLIRERTAAVNKALRHATAIVARARREKGMYQ